MDIDFELDVPVGNYRIEVFDSPSGVDPTLHGEGEVYLGFADIVHTGSGVESFSVTLTSVAPSSLTTVTATATEDLGGGNFGSTSEFSKTINSRPSLTSLDDTSSFTEGGAAVVLDVDVSVADQQLDAIDNYSGASVTLRRDTGPNADDVFSFNDGSGISLVGSSLIKNGQIIAVFDLATTPGELSIVLTDANGETPSGSDVDNVLRQITYSNTSDSPPATVQIDWTFDDGNTGAQGSGGAMAANDSTDVNITAVNDAPVLDNTGSTNLPTITKLQTNNSGADVATIIASAGGDRITDVDAGAVEGIAITTLASGNGTWEYSTNGGISWNVIGSVSNTSALLLGADDSVRFVPNGLNGTSASFDFYAWDQTSGTAGTKVDASTGGGMMAFSTASETASIVVTDVNTAPVLDNSKDPALTAVNEDAGVPSGAVGSLVSELVDFATPSGQIDNVTDVDSGAGLGIAITAADSTNGVWFYSINNGANWNALGAVSGSNARLLAADVGTRLYFQANADYHGTLATAITFHAWDQTSGTNGGTTNFVSTFEVLDQFSVASYSVDNGTANWAGDWIESDDDGLATGGDVQIVSGKLRLNNAGGGILPSIERHVDLSGASSATFSFDYAGISTGLPERFKAWASDNGGSTWVELEEFTPAGTGAFSGSRSYDLGSSIGLTNNVAIRFSPRTRVRQRYRLRRVR